MKIFFAVLGLLAFFWPALHGSAAFAADVFAAEVGDVEVGMLSEGQSDGDPEILIGASEADIAKFIPGGRQASAVAVYVVRTKDGPLLIDTGFGRNVERNLKAFGLTPDDITHVLITHSHRDHIGGLLKGGEKAFPNARVYIAKKEYDWSEAARETLKPYGDAVELIDPGTLDEPGKPVAAGVLPIAAYGHTPGHTMFMLESAGQRLLFWGDLTHAMQIQMPRPGVSVTYDADPVEAARARRDVLRFVAENGIPVAGMHVPFPGIGRVEADGDNPGGYVFLPFAE
jgi:glyoxylase-like metal-dependent hydrolase (beta-lactamase superfamily II)